MTTDENNRRPVPGSCQLAVQFEAGDAGQMDIQHETSGICCLAGLQEGLGAGEAECRETGG